MQVALEGELIGVAMDGIGPFAWQLKRGALGEEHLQRAVYEAGGPLAPDFLLGTRRLRKQR